VQNYGIDANKSTDYKYLIGKYKKLLGGGWAWVRLGKIKCGAKALAQCVGLHLF
jgi:hypothetical protein